MYLILHVRKWLAGGLAALLLLVSGAILLHAALPVDAAVGEGDVRLPIIMYHGILKEEKRQGKFVISPAQFEDDLRYLQEQGYTTVVMADVIDFVLNGTPLPEKPVMLTFDDGYYNDYVYAYPLLKKYNSKMVFSPIGRYVDQYSDFDERNANYTHATWDDINEMIASGLVEVQNHTYNMHANQGGRKGCMRKKGEPVEAYQQALREDVGKMQSRMEEMTGVIPTTFVYPFGAISKEARPVLKELGFQATLVCESRTNTLTDDPECLYGLGRYLRPSGIDSKTYFTKTVKLP